MGAACPKVPRRSPKVRTIAAILAFERQHAEGSRRIARGEHDVALPAVTYHLCRHRGYRGEALPPPQEIFWAAA